MQRTEFMTLLAAAGAASLPGTAAATGAKAGKMCLPVAEKYRKGMLPFDLPLLGSPDTMMKSANLTGKAIWLNFFASWCPDCTVEMPSLLAIAAKYRDAGLTVIGIDVDETEKRGTSFQNQFNISYPILVDAGATVFKTVGTGHLPTHMFYTGDRYLTCVGIEGFTEKDMDNEVSVALGL
jgi:thiol-disulfide isomerase/thioredoxin